MSWVPVTRPTSQPTRTIRGGLEMDSNSTLPFLENEPLDLVTLPEEPVAVIVSRVLFALLISASLVMNLLLIIAIIRCKGKVLVIYLLTASLIIPDVLFYVKIIVELTDYGDNVPAWASTDQVCGTWQWVGHVYPMLYSFTLTAIIYHAFITLFMDNLGQYEIRCGRLLPLILIAMYFVIAVITAPSAIYARSLLSAGLEVTPHTRQFCHLTVPSITGSTAPDVLEESYVIYRLVYELVLPYLLPLFFFFFPYICLLVGLMRSIDATDHASHTVKISVVAALWLVTSYMMMHVATVLSNVFSVFTVWHKLTTVLDATDDPRVPVFQTYLHISATCLTILWGCIRPGLVFKYSRTVRKGLSP